MNRHAPHALRSGLHRDQQRLVARADRSADAVERHIHAVWARVLEIIAAGGNWFSIFNAARDTLAALHLLPRILAADFHDAADHARETTADHLRGKLPPLFEAEGDPDPDPASFDPWRVPRRTWEDLPLFEPPSALETARLIYSTGWEDRLAALTRLAAPDTLAALIATGHQQGKTLAAPDTLAALIATGHQQGKTPAQIARLIRPAVQGVQTSARRIARTESLRIAHDVQMEMYEEVPGVIGYQIHSMHFPATRHWHAKRDGTIYYRNPGPGQKGFRQMPRPPLEAPDPSERPAGTPQVAHNCLCWLTPVMGAMSPADRARSLVPLIGASGQTDE